MRGVSLASSEVKVRGGGTRWPPLDRSSSSNEIEMIEEFEGQRFVLVYQSVVIAAEQTEIVQIGGAAVGPVDDVMGVTPARVAPTSSDDAVTVSGD